MKKLIPCCFLQFIFHQKGHLCVPLAAVPPSDSRSSGSRPQSASSIKLNTSFPPPPCPKPSFFTLPAPPSPPRLPTPEPVGLQGIHRRQHVVNPNEGEPSLLEAEEDLAGCRQTKQLETQQLQRRKLVVKDLSEGSPGPARIVPIPKGPDTAHSPFLCNRNRSIAFFQMRIFYNRWYDYRRAGGSGV